MQFHDAKKFCDDRNSFMVRIDDMKENNWVLHQDTTHYGRWLGMTRIRRDSNQQKKANYHWLQDNSIPTFTNFSELFLYLLPF